MEPGRGSNVDHPGHAELSWTTSPDRSARLPQVIGLRGRVGRVVLHAGWIGDDCTLRGASSRTMPTS